MCIRSLELDDQRKNLPPTTTTAAASHVYHRQTVNVDINEYYSI